MPGRVVAVVGVDTFQDLSVKPPAAFFRERAEAFRKDFAAGASAMARQLLHRDADPKLVKDLESRFQKASPEVVTALMETFSTYDNAKPAADAHVPIRCLNGDLYPTNVQANRKIVGDFDAVIFPHTGHYPMMEKPQQFNQRLEEIVRQFSKPQTRTEKPSRASRLALPVFLAYLPPSIYRLLPPSG
jgi:pimeloyl-ACP methyl ester carboxylesterase